jgi:hypothetical protein
MIRKALHSAKLHDLIICDPLPIGWAIDAKLESYPVHELLSVGLVFPEPTRRYFELPWEPAVSRISSTKEVDQFGPRLG